jgi:hypothetical protein
MKAEKRLGGDPNDAGRREFRISILIRSGSIIAISEVVSERKTSQQLRITNISFHS